MEGKGTVEGMLFPERLSNGDRPKHTVLPDPQHLPSPHHLNAAPWAVQPPTVPDPFLGSHATQNTSPRQSCPSGRPRPPPAPQGWQSQPQASLHCGATAPTQGHLSRSSSIEAPLRGSLQPAACLPAHMSCPRGARAAAGPPPAPGHVLPALWGPAGPRGWADRTGSR